ncbi:hypothetical protein TNCV_1048611 [Trichonephila clavipes]|nr:hypothetical protein TNCV_1048611 [Trichonephila clavipes]
MSPRRETSIDKKRLEFAKTHQLKTDNFWKKVIFSDENKFNIFGSDGRRTVWRKPNTALDPKNLRLTVKHGGGSVMAGRRSVVAGQVDRSECAVRNCWEQWTRAENRVWSDQEDYEERRSKDRAASTHLAEANLKSKRSFRALPLTPEHRQLRLQWYQARSMRNVTDWVKVVFSDESRFVLGTDDNHVRVWRRPSERYNSPTLFYVTLPAQLV